MTESGASVYRDPVAAPGASHFASSLFVFRPPAPFSLLPRPSISPSWPCLDPESRYCFLIGSFCSA